MDTGFEHSKELRKALAGVLDSLSVEARRQPLHGTRRDNRGQGSKATPIMKSGEQQNREPALRLENGLRQTNNQ